MTQYFKNHKCFLCDEVHPLLFNDYIARKTPFNEIYDCEGGYVVRVRCDDSILKQKTMTILPYFISPYARHFSSDMIDSINNYIEGKVPNQCLAANKMKAADEKSFRRYYKRVVERCSGWTLVLLQWLTEKSISTSWEKKPFVSNARIDKRWHYFKYLAEQYLMEIAKIPDTYIITNEDKLPYILALLTQNHLGLGP